MSLSREFIKFGSKLGVADVDDIIHNTSGPIIGILLYAAYERLNDALA